MHDLFKAEWLRFRSWGITAAFVHLLVLRFLARVVDLAQQPLVVYRAFGGAYMLAGLLLGLYQMGGYRRPNAWLNLLHRPLPAARIAAALFAAGACWLAVAVALPVLVIAAYQAGMTARVVDLRHWLLPLASLLLAAAAYLAGAFAMLANRRYAACGLVFLVLFTAAHATGFGALALQVLALLWLGVMVVAAFKPDLAAPPRTLAATLATAIPLQAGVYLLVLLLGFGIEMLWIMQGSHPNNMGMPPRGGHNQLERMDDKQRMLAGLSASTAAQAPLWREQVALSDTHGVGRAIVGIAFRNELTNRAPMEFDDAQQRVRWVFSHDSMRFEGYDLADGRRVGSLGVGARQLPFPVPALAAGGLPALPGGDDTLLAGNMLYHYASDTRRVTPRIRLPAAETLVGMAPIGEALGVLSDRALYFFDGREVTQSDALLKPRQRAPIPGLYGDLRNLELIELVDGYLVSFSFSANAHNPRGAAPQQSLLWVHDDGTTTSVARRRVNYDYPALYRYQGWWPSPALYALRRGAIDLFAPVDPLAATAPPRVPRAMWMLAGALSLLSLLGATWRLRRRSLPLPARVAWMVACAVIGMPALASLWLLYPQREPLQARPPRPPAAA